MENINSLLDTLHLEDLQNEAHSSIFDDNEKYDMLILRVPFLESGLEINSFGFIITKDGSYFYDRKSKRFETYENRFEMVHKKLDVHIDNLLKYFGSYIDQIDDMEEQLYVNDIDKGLMKRWLNLKKDISTIERITYRASLVITDVIEHYEHCEDFKINKFVDLHEHLERVNRACTLHLSKLDYIHSYYITQSNEKMNSLIYLLTIISAIFLPLNLLVGFFGMNTTGLPFTQGTTGTMNVILIMAFLFGITTLIIKIVQKKV